jgi:hypothetical protein
MNEPESRVAFREAGHCQITTESTGHVWPKALAGASPRRVGGSPQRGSFHDSDRRSRASNCSTDVLCARVPEQGDRQRRRSVGCTSAGGWIVLALSTGCAARSAPCGGDDCAPAVVPCEAQACLAGQCSSGSANECVSEALCPSTGSLCADGCAVPSGPVLDPIHVGAVLRFTAEAASVEVGWADPDADEPSEWLSQSTVVLPEKPARLKVFARVAGGECAERFEHVYDVRDAYPTRAGEPESDAVALDDARITTWATGFVDPVSWGSDVDSPWRDPEQALGPAQGTSLDVVGLGNGGRIVLTFEPPIADGLGADLAVFENSFDDTFLELGFVEVSSDGTHFVRFDSAYLGQEPVSAFGRHEPSVVGGLAGKYRQGYGTPFDLSTLTGKPAVVQGAVDLGAIRFVGIVDIEGDGSVRDSFGNPIFDPTPTDGSGGFDLDAVAVLNSAE